MSTSITVFDTDGGNPYGREVASLLLGLGYDVRMALPVDCGWIPDGLPARRLLPANGPSSLASQALRQVAGLLWIAGEALLRRRLIVVIMTRAWYDQLFIALLARLGARLAVVAHDPVPKAPLPPLAAFARRALWRAADRLVVHSEAMAEQARTQVGVDRSLAVVGHLPFTSYADWASRAAPGQPEPGRLRLLVLGQMRHDKGLDRLPAIIERLPPAARARISIAFAGRGSIPGLMERLGALIEITMPIATQRVPDAGIAEALARSDMLIAPYPLVSASGSVVLALCRGLRVLAYDAGAIRDVLADDGLVPPGDEERFAARLAEAIAGDGGRCRTPLPAWRATAAREWGRALAF